ncbi:MAG: hypothetical protein ACI9VR_003447 [Cognaticolwellia sp.]|jgi:hypothetical protein
MKAFWRRVSSSHQARSFQGYKGLAFEQALKKDLQANPVQSISGAVLETMSFEPRRPIMISARLPLAAILASSLALTGCTKDEEVDDTETTETATDDTADTEVEGEGQVRVIHMSPDAPNVDVFVDGIDDAVVTDLSFPNTTAYLDLAIGTYTFRVAPAGTSAADAVLVFEDVEVTEGLKLTAGAYNEVASLEGFALVDDSEGLASTDLRVTVIHAAPAVGSVDIWEISGEPMQLLNDVPFGASATLPDLPSQAYVIGVDVNEDGVPDLSWNIPALPGGTQANLYAASQGEDIFLVAQLAEGETIRLDPNPSEDE